MTEHDIYLPFSSPFQINTILDRKKERNWFEFEHSWERSMKFFETRIKIWTLINPANENHHHPKKILVKSYSVTRYWKMVENFKANAENGWRRPFYESPLEWWKQGYRGTEWQPNPVFVERFHHGPHTYRSRTHETGVEARLIIKPCARNRATSASRTGLNLAFWFTSRNSVPAVELRISEITTVFKISIESFYQNFLFKRIHPNAKKIKKQFVARSSIF